MESSDKQFYEDLMREDEVGLVLRGHLHIEKELVDLISSVVPFPSRCDWSKIGYRGKLELAISCGVPEEMRKSLETIGTLRNEYAHLLGSGLEKERILDIYNGLPDSITTGLKKSYQAMGKGNLDKPSKVDKRDLLILILLNLKQAIRSMVSDV